MTLDSIFQIFSGMTRPTIKSIAKSNFQDLPKLWELMLQDNQIEVIPAEAFIDLKALKKIHLRKFSFFAKLFLFYFNCFSVDNNKIKSIKANPFKGLNNLNFVDLRSNDCIKESFATPTQTANLKKVVKEKCETSNPSIYFSIDPENHQISLVWFNVKVSSNVVIVVSDRPMVADLDNSGHLTRSRYSNYLYELKIVESEESELLGRTHDFEKSYKEEFNGCYNLWWYLVVNGYVVDSGCMNTNKNWMYQMKSKLKNLKIREIAIPGTHDSGSYVKGFMNSIISWKDLPNRYALTQDDDIYSQLKHGIRYFDIRIKYYPDRDEEFWVHHGPVDMHPLSTITEQFARFMQFSKEIVIFDIHQLAGNFDDSAHSKLVQFLKENLGRYAADSTLGWSTTLGAIWESQNLLIITYPNNRIRERENQNFLWQTVDHKWGEINRRASQLIEFLRGSRTTTLQEQQSRPFAEMAELTANKVPGYVSYIGIRNMANAVNFDVTKLYHGEFGRNANIVAVDFYRSTNIANIAIEWNEKKVGIEGTNVESKMYLAKNPQMPKMKPKTELNP